MVKLGVEQSVYSDWKVMQIKVLDVLFVMVKEVEDQWLVVVLKVSLELVELLCQQYCDVWFSQYFNKVYWSIVYLDGLLLDL